MSLSNFERSRSETKLPARANIRDRASNSKIIRDVYYQIILTLTVRRARGGADRIALSRDRLGSFRESVIARFLLWFSEPWSTENRRLQLAATPKCNALSDNVVIARARVKSVCRQCAEKKGGEKEREKERKTSALFYIARFSEYSSDKSVT